MKKIIIMFLFIFVSHSSFASGLQTENDCKTFSDQLIDQLSQTKFQEALDTAKPYWPIPKVEIDGMVNQINQQWPIINQRFGKTVGNEFVGTERIGKSFLRFVYLHKFENHSIYWQIDFYKPKKEWKINKISFHDDLDSLYQ